MELLNNQALTPGAWATVSYDRWVSDLQSICGSFNPKTMEHGKTVTGAARRIDVCGMEFAHVSNDLDRVHRDWQDIRRDASDHLFLITQLEGSCGIEHVGQQAVLNAGDCILVDSTRPTTFYFGGNFSNHLSLHLPRQLMYSESQVEFEIARRLEAHDPMAMMLRALVAKIMATAEADARSANLRQLLFEATRQAFASSGDVISSLNDSAARRLQLMDMLIDRHLTDSALSAKWLATRIGVSMRTLQQDFQGIGVTCTTVIRDKRLRLVREKIQQIKEQKGGRSIAEMAYAAGFNDISYFNRSFKDLFDCAPTDLLKTAQVVTQ